MNEYLLLKKLEHSSSIGSYTNSHLKTNVLVHHLKNSLHSSKYVHNLRHHLKLQTKPVTAETIELQK